MINDSGTKEKNLFQSSIKLRYILNLSDVFIIKKLSKYQMENDIAVAWITKNLSIYFINFLKFTIIVLFYYLNFRTK